MTIYDTVSADLKTARYAKDSVKISILSTLLGEMSSKAVVVNGSKVVSDLDAKAVLKKLLKGVNEMVGYAPADTKLQLELTLLESYLPAQMTEQEIIHNVNNIRQAAGDNLNLGQIMAQFKQQYPGLYDGQLLSNVVKSLLTKA